VVSGVAVEHAGKKRSEVDGGRLFDYWWTREPGHDQVVGGKIGLPRKDRNTRAKAGTYDKNLKEEIKSIHF